MASGYAQPGARWGVTLESVVRARSVLPAEIVRTPLLRADWLDAAAGGPVWLKDETRGPTGAFKIRGATNMIAALSDDARRRGVVTCSTGNHGRAVAFAAARAGVRAVVCLSELVPEYRREAIRGLGAEVRVIGASQDEAFVEAERLARDEGLTVVPPFDDPLIVAGQGTIGLEIAESLPDTGTVLIGLSGGGLLGGIALALKSIKPDVHIVGLSTDNGGAAMYESLRADRPVEVPEPPSLADSLGGGIGLDNRCTFGLCRELLDEVVLLSEAEIAAGMRAVYRNQRMVVEGSAAVGPAALLAGKVPPGPTPVVCILSGNLVDMDVFTAVVNGADALP
ncbi:MAG: hydroxyectoine utilization dehydratase EutB [Halofilum sp. (in: g-proteobacteria)]|nr:hydroxyectoine utilization dehydratase EutB [Halofilum sp. (in: g-proteobacteria)]